MRKILIVLLFFIAIPAFATRGHWQGDAQQGGHFVATNSFHSTTQVQQSYPACTVTVYQAGTTTLATIYSDVSGTAKVNPFTAASTGRYDFYSDETTVDIKFSGTGITTPFTLSSIGANVGSGALATYINVRDTPYSAAGDGITDDTTAITSAITAATASGGTVFIPSGTYKITSQLNISNSTGVEILGAGWSSNLVFIVTDIGIGGSSNTNLTISNLKITGASARAVSCTSCTRFTVRRCFISGATLSTTASGFPAGIYAASSNYSAIENNFLTGNGFGASNTQSSTDILIDSGGSNNSIEGNWAVSTAVTMNIILETGAGSVATVYNKIAGNICSGAVSKPNKTLWGYGIAVYMNTVAVSLTTIEKNIIASVGGNGIYNQGATGTVINGNIVYDSCKTILAGTIDVGGIVSNATSDAVTISNNTLRTCGQAMIEVDSTNTVVIGNTLQSGSKVGININASTNITAASNTISSLNGGVNSIGIQVQTSQGVSLTGNQLYNVPADGILAASCGGLVITSNIFKDGGAATTNTYDAIYLQSDSDSLISNNYITGTDYRYGITNTGTRNQLVGNRIFNTATGGVLDSGTLTVRDRNWFSLTGAMRGTAVLVAGSVTVATTEVLTGDIIRISRLTAGGTVGGLSYTNIVNKTSFDIVSTNGAETSTVLWEIVH